MKHCLYPLIVLLTYLSASAQFRYSPERPKIDGSVSFTYTPSGVLTPGTGAVQAVVLRYGSPLQMRLSQPETVTTAQVGSDFVGKIKVPFKEVSGLLVAFQDKNNPALIDHNNAHFYPVLLYGKTGAMLPHALGGQASVMMRTSFPYQLKIKPDWAWVVEQYEREVQQNPTTRPLYWADVVRAKIKQANPDYRQVCLAEIETYLARPAAPLTPADLTNAAQLYDQLKEPGLALKARERIRSVDPRSDEVQKSRLEAIRAEPDLGKKRAIFGSLIAATPKSTYRAAAVSAMAQAYFEAGKLRELVDFMGAEAAPETDPALLLSFAQQLASEGRGWPQAEWLANRAIWGFNQKVSLSKTTQVRQAQSVLAQALDQQGQLLPALNRYRELWTGVAPKQTDPAINERIWLCARKTSRADSVLPYIQNVLRVGQTTKLLRDNLRDWQTSRLGGARELATYLSNLELIDQADRRADIAAKLVDEPAPAFTLNTLDGRRVSLAGLAGKVVVVDFWATWCNPCLASLPAKRQVRDAFQNDGRVQFLFVNSQEVEPIRRVRRFVAKQPYMGSVPLDPDQAMANAYKVKLIPTSLIIDPRGRLRYRTIGYSDNPQATADELKQVIEALKE